ncbi:MAG: hypothetical protein ACRDF0_06760, partial [Candidatus Limnocylindria bacterium]
LAGSSAGAMMLGELTFVPVARDGETGMPRDVYFRPALGLLPGTFVLPHYDSVPATELERWRHLFPPGLAMLSIDDDTALIEERGRWRVRGRGRVVRFRSFAERESFVAGASIDGIAVAAP